MQELLEFLRFRGYIVCGTIVSSTRIGKDKETGVVTQSSNEHLVNAFYMPYAK